MVTKIRKNAAQHGTRSKYALGCRCGACRAANTTYLRAWELRTGVKKYGAAEWDRIRPKMKCGTASSYTGGCRCDDCRTAWATYKREYRRRKRLALSQAATACEDA